MATPIIPSALERTAHWHGVEWFGDADALIAAGICTADQLPGLPGQNKWSRTFKSPIGRKVHISRTGRRFKVYLSNAEILGRALEKLACMAGNVQDRSFATFMARSLKPVDLED